MRQPTIGGCCSAPAALSRCFSWPPARRRRKACAGSRRRGDRGSDGSTRKAIHRVRRELRDQLRRRALAVVAPEPRPKPELSGAIGYLDTVQRPLPRAHAAHLSAMDADGRRDLWRRPVHAGHPRRHASLAIPTPGRLLRTSPTPKEAPPSTLFLLFGFLASLWATPRYGRIPMQVAGFSGMAFGMLLLLFAADGGRWRESHLAFVIGALCFSISR